MASRAAASPQSGPTQELAVPGSFREAGSAGLAQEPVSPMSGACGQRALEGCCSVGLGRTKAPSPRMPGPVEGAAVVFPPGQQELPAPLPAPPPPGLTRLSVPRRRSCGFSTPLPSSREKLLRPKTTPVSDVV